MIHKVQNISKVANLFTDWEDTMIYSCLQNVMGDIYVNDEHNPRSACASLGCFVFFAGEPDRDLVEMEFTGFCIMVPQNQAWAKQIEISYPSAKQVTRYAIKKNTIFDQEHLQHLVEQLPAGYQLRCIDGELFDRCLENPATADFVSTFESKDQYLSMGRGRVIIKEGEIVSGASSYSRYQEGIEIEVDTVPSERRKHLATVACASLILGCLKDGLYPSWDAQNLWSVALAEKLGYTFDHEYTAYEVMRNL